MSLARKRAAVAVRSVSQSQLLCIPQRRGCATQQQQEHVLPSPIHTAIGVSSSSPSTSPVSSSTALGPTTSVFLAPTLAYDPSNELLVSLLRIQKMYNVFRPGDTVIDVGCMPGVVSRFILTCISAPTPIRLDVKNASSHPTPPTLEDRRSTLIRRKKSLKRSNPLDDLLDSIDAEVEIGERSHKSKKESSYHRESQSTATDHQIHQQGVLIGIDEVAPSTLLKGSGGGQLFAGAHFIHSSVEALSNNPSLLHSALQGTVVTPTFTSGGGNGNQLTVTTQYSSSAYTTVRKAFGTVDAVFIDLGSLQEEDVISAGRQLLALPCNRGMAPEAKQALLEDVLGAFTNSNRRTSSAYLVGSEQTHRKIIRNNQRRLQEKYVLPTLTPEKRAIGQLGGEVGVVPPALGTSIFKGVEIRDPTAVNKRFDSANEMSTSEAMVASLAVPGHSGLKEDMDADGDDTNNDEDRFGNDGGGVGGVTIEVPVSGTVAESSFNTTNAITSFASNSASSFVATSTGRGRWELRPSSSIYASNMVAARRLNGAVPIAPEKLMQCHVAKQLDSLEHALRVFSPLLKKHTGDGLTSTHSVPTTPGKTTTTGVSTYIPRSVSSGTGGRMLFRLLLPATGEVDGVGGDGRGGDIPYETSYSFSRFVDSIKKRFTFAEVVDKRWIKRSISKATCSSEGVTPSSYLQLMVLACNSNTGAPNEQKQLARAEIDNPAALLLFNEGLRRDIANARAAATVGSMDDQHAQVYDMPRARHPSQPIGARYADVNESSKMKNFKGIFKTFSGAGGTSAEGVVGGGNHKFRHSHWSPISGFRRREGANAKRTMGTGSNTMDTSRMRTHKSPFFTTTHASAAKTQSTISKLGRTSHFEQHTNFQVSNPPRFAQAPMKEELLLRAKRQGTKEDRYDKYETEFLNVKRSILDTDGFNRDYNE